MSSKRNSALYRIYLAVLAVAAAIAVAEVCSPHGRQRRPRRPRSLRRTSASRRHGDDPCRSGPPHDAGDVDGHGADHVRVPLVPVRRSGARPTPPTAAGSRTRLPTPTLAPGGRRLPHPQPGRRKQRRRLGQRDVEPDERRDLATSDEHEGAVHLGHGQSRKPLASQPGEWAGEQPITYSYAWLRCNAQGDNCSEIQGATDTAYEVRDADTGRTIRVRVTARNDRGTTSAISNQTGVVGGGTPPPPATGATRPVPAGSRRPTDRLPGSVHPEPGDEQHGADRGSRAAAPLGEAAR